MSIVMRQEVERKIATALIAEGLKAGYSISVNNGGDEDEIPPSNNIDVILEAMFATDDEYLNFYKDGKLSGCVWLVYTNDGWDVITDYSARLESIMGEANKISDHYADQTGV